MDSLIYLINKFSHEALFLELIAVFAIAGTYFGYVLRKKSKFGATEKNIPENYLKTYLSQLVIDAEDLKIELFGLLRKDQIKNLQEAGTYIESPSHHPTLAHQTPLSSEGLKELEQKLHEQLLAYETLQQEKLQLHQTLENVMTARSAEPIEASDEELKELREKLAEYAVLENDLANLKRLQIENKKLKDQISTSVTTQITAQPQEQVQAAHSLEKNDFEKTVDQVEAKLSQLTQESIEQEQAQITKENAAVKNTVENTTDLNALFEKMSDKRT